MAWSGMVGRPLPGPPPQTAWGRENGRNLVAAGSNSPLSARNERGGAGGGAPRGRSPMPAEAESNSPLSPRNEGGGAGGGGPRRAQSGAVRRHPDPTTTPPLIPPTSALTHFRTSFHDSRTIRSQPHGRAAPGQRAHGAPRVAA